MHSTSSSADSYTRRLASSVASRLFSPGKRKQLNQRVASPNKLEAGPQKPHSRRVAKVMACIRKRRFAELSKASPLQSTRTLRCTRRSAGARETGETDEDEVERLKQLADLGDFKNASTFEMKHRVVTLAFSIDRDELRLRRTEAPCARLVEMSLVGWLPTVSGWLPRVSHARGGRRAKHTLHTVYTVNSYNNAIL
jgi:hypothetical protein